MRIWTSEEMRIWTLQEWLKKYYGNGRKDDSANSMDSSAQTASTTILSGKTILSSGEIDADSRKDGE